MGVPLLGLGALQWIALLTAVQTALLLADALAGHYRSGFPSRAQYAPFLSGGLLIFSALGAVIAPGAPWSSVALRAAGWLGLVTGVVGAGFHHVHGIARRPGGYRWLLHNLMYGAPPLAPLALGVMGALALLVAQGLGDAPGVSGAGLRSALLLLTGVALAGAVLQAGMLHYRGAFHSLAMYVPLTVPLLTAVSCLVAALAPGPLLSKGLPFLLWPTVLIGFLGLGMHLRGFDRQMGGLHLFLFNVLEGPPAWAPALFAGLGLVGLLALRLG